jgi:oxygen-independent coproporphyrinogen-3 oxidase
MSEHHPERWLQQVEGRGHGLVTDEALTLEECADEMLLMGLRLSEGIRPDRYAAMSGRSFSESRLAFLKEHGFVEPCGAGRLRATREGWLVLDSVVADLAA